ncbi:hypothetical protein LguiB_013874 [Lonicera macranthoides]
MSRYKKRPIDGLGGAYGGYNNNNKVGLEKMDMKEKMGLARWSLWWAQQQPGRNMKLFRLRKFDGY